MNLLEEKNTNLGKVLVGVSDVGIILQLYKNTISFSAEGVLEK
jgi:hypothetical protein